MKHLSVAILVIRLLESCSRRLAKKSKEKKKRNQLQEPDKLKRTFDLFFFIARVEQRSSRARIIADVRRGKLAAVYSVNSV